MDAGLTTAAKLEPFLLMAKSARGAAAAKLVGDACAAPGVFVFGELLDMPSVADVRAAPATRDRDAESLCS
jgi:COP9 signalosome complex subunit 7